MDGGGVMYPIGTQVVYTNARLYSTGQAPTGDACRYRGVIVDAQDVLEGLDPLDFAVVQWSHSDELIVVNLANIAPLRTAKAQDVPSWVSMGRKGRRR